MAASTLPAAWLGAETEDNAVRPFSINTPEEALADLRKRTAATRLPDRELVGDPSQGVQLATMQALARYWGTDYDLRWLEKPSLARYLQDPKLRGYAVLQKIFFAPTESSQAAGEAFVARLGQRQADREPPSGPAVAAAQLGAFREWEQWTGTRFADLQTIRQPTLVVNGVHDEMIPVRNSYWLGEHLPNAVLFTFPDAGHGSLFQWHASFARQVTAFLADQSAFAPY